MRALPWIMVVVLLLALTAAGFAIHTQLKREAKGFDDAYKKGRADGARNVQAVRDKYSGSAPDEVPSARSNSKNVQR